VRILLVSRELAGFYGGGIGTYALEMARLLSGRGHEVHLLTGPHEGLAARAPGLLPGVRVHRVDLDEGRAALEAYPTFPMRYAMAAHERVMALSAQRPFDSIEFPDYHAEGYFTIGAKRTLGVLAGTTLAVRLHSTSFLCREADAEPRLDAEMATIEHMERHTIAAADVLIAPAQRVLDRAPAPLADHRQRREVIPLPLDVDVLVRDFGGERKESGGGMPTVLFFGKLQHLKGVQDLVDAAVLLLEGGTAARFMMIGNDSPTGPFGRSMLEHLKRRIPAHLADSISFEPARPRNDLGAAIRAAAVCVFPSLWESFPLVCLEAMSLGAPVVVSDVGGLGEIVRDGESGLVCPAGDAGSLARAIERLLRDDALRRRVAAGAPRRVRELCDPGRVLEQVEAVAGAPRDAAPSATGGMAATTPGRPAVSIIIPFYNLAAYLPETLESARAQTFRDCEILIVDDGSTDAAARALLEALPRDVRIIRKPNGGLGSARNAGLREARGEWVAPLDADDLLEPETVETLLGAAARNPGASYISPLVRYFNDPLDRAPRSGGNGDAAMLAENGGGWVPLGLVPDLLPVLNVGGAASGSLIRREHALEIGGWDESMPAYEDWEFWCRMHDAGRRGAIVPEFLLRYRVRAGSMFRTELSRHLSLHSYILLRHPGLINERTARILASRGVRPDAGAAARQLIAENIRYRLADRLNEALKRVGVQRAIKGVARTVMRPEP
jgi:glycosyltransferase involved in cell wall biosynthesis